MSAPSHHPGPLGPGLDDGVAVVPYPDASVGLVGSLVENQRPPASGSEPGAAQRPYRTGDRLPGVVELAGVEADRALLRRDGKVETLALPRAGALPRSTTVPMPVR